MKCEFFHTGILIYFSLIFDDFLGFIEKLKGEIPLFLTGMAFLHLCKEMEFLVFRGKLLTEVQVSAHKSM